MLYNLFKNLIFKIDPESAHHFTMRMMKVGSKVPPLRGIMGSRLSIYDPRLVQIVNGMEFENPVGLAAGFDKNAKYLGILPLFGFAFIEIGTVTATGQAGNPRPRLFRLPTDHAILNRMGFNNEGAKVVARRLRAFFKKNSPLTFRLGVNIGKTKVVPVKDAVDDYLLSFSALYEFADYIVVNVSSPNTPNLRDLQQKEPLSKLLAALQEKNRSLSAAQSRDPKPLFVKVAPDLSDGALFDLIDVVRESGASGIIATNTTISRDGLASDSSEVERLGAGGISGRPLTTRSLEMIRFFHKNAPELTIIGVGGIFTAEDALNAIKAGASLVQVWTGFVYEGPSIVRSINKGLLKACEENGWSHISEAIGLDVNNTPKRIGETAC